ncbi:hypothetical protein [Methylobacterium haplocladii]|uniref:Uncharacterized protein n=1 Tax=Methylobacterium haplocladii TaxID=1176176 RepID=A0A512ISA6_9HYPH|nr:hypothetical protein [Methylobacterium haplocladii]GEP00595.1 hypothetical protein MHA02_29820 [Methylobacterium haplocladii]GJD85510.1 hypothetical protein HPGCJGGD_3399 [Methylobacterium haplocladii]GLS57743.1 hypothetical protein GCM10007887_03990 [Methylobacterium haplocladii]
MAKIIELKQFRRGSVRCPAIGLVFPQLYRRRGVNWTYPPGKDDSNFEELIPGIHPDINYTLTTEDDGTVANPEWDPIEHPSPEYETGWIIVRHHQSHAHVEGYLDGYGDMVATDRLGRMVFETSTGLFTVLQRDPLPGQPQPLIAYATKVPHPMVGEDHWYKVLGIDGVEHESSVLLPDIMF